MMKPERSDQEPDNQARAKSKRDKNPAQNPEIGLTLVYGSDTDFPTGVVVPGEAAYEAVWLSAWQKIGHARCEAPSQPVPSER
jgi:hypothetical protein